MAHRRTTRWPGSDLSRFPGLLLLLRTRAEQELRGHPRWTRSLLLLLVTLAPFTASAEPARQEQTVILLQPTNASIATRRSLARIRDELSADRFRVIWEGSETTDGAAPVIEGPGGHAEPEAIVVLFGDPAAGHAELRVIHRAEGRSAVRRGTVIVDDPEQMPRALASRALELLRATALELSLPRERPLSAPESARPCLEGSSAQRRCPKLPPPEDSIASVEMGLALWKGIAGPPPAVTPVGRLSLRLSNFSQMRLSVAGLGSRPLVRTPYGTASVSQSMALLELALAPRGDQRLHPLLSLGAGVIHVAVAGTGVAPYEGLNARQWSAAVDAGAGVALALSSRAALSTELHAFLASPRPVVRFVDTNAATIGSPTLMFSLALRVAL